MDSFRLRKWCPAHVLQTREQRVKWQLPNEDGLMLMLCGRDDEAKLQPLLTLIQQHHPHSWKDFYTRALLKEG